MNPGGGEGRGLAGGGVGGVDFGDLAGDVGGVVWGGGLGEQGRGKEGEGGELGAKVFHGDTIAEGGVV